jgi:fatty acid-binding protein DegV
MKKKHLKKEKQSEKQVISLLLSSSLSLSFKSIRASSSLSFQHEALFQS